MAAELLRKLLEEEIKVHARTNIIQSRKFSEMLADALVRYHNRSIETLEVIEELISLATKVRDDRGRGEKLGLGPAEIAFYDALAANQSARDLMKDEVLRKLATELAQIIRKNVTIDWTVRENVQANMRRLVKRLLRKYKYPPDLQESATLIVLEQAKQIADEMSKPEGE